MRQLRACIDGFTLQRQMEAAVPAHTADDAGPRAWLHRGIAAAVG
jgi:hypothetical protein